MAVLLPDLRPGGAEKVRVSLVREFVRRGLSVDVVLLQASGELLEALPPQARVVDLSARRIRDGLRPLIGYLRRRRPRSLLAAMWPLTVVAILARALSGVRTRLVISDHTDYLATPLARSAAGRLKLAASMRGFYPKADAVAAVSAGVAQSVERLARLPAGSIAVIHNPFEIRAAAPPAAGEVPAAWRDFAGARVLSVGALKEAKDFAGLLAAIALVRRERPVKLLILGEGPLRADLEARRAELGLEDDVLMPGHVPVAQRFMPLADLFVLSSAWEGFPNVVGEALAAGVPVVSTDCRSGPREILGDSEYGRLAPPGDPAALARAILAELADPHPREALLARAAEFTVARASDLYLGLLLPGG